MTATVAITISVWTNDIPSVEEIGLTHEVGSIDSEIAIVDSAKETSVQDALESGNDNLSVPPDQETSDSIELADTNSADVLSMESQDIIRAVVYEVVASPNISSVAYLDKIECGNSGCDMDLKFYDTGRIHRKTASLMADINASLEKNPSTERLQFGITMLNVGDDGIGGLTMKTMPKQEQTFKIIVVGRDTTD